MSQIDDQRKQAHIKWKQSQSKIAIINESLKQLKVGAGTASSATLPRYEKLIKDKTTLLRETEIQTTNLFNQLEALNFPAKEDAPSSGNSPYADVKRSRLSDEVKAKIVREHGREAYLKQPL